MATAILAGFQTGSAVRLMRKKKQLISYLYGTPSENGNIGLRVGDTVTYYDGAVLSLIEGYPYAHISRSKFTNADPDGIVVLRLFDTMMESYGTGSTNTYGESYNIMPVGGDLGTVDAMYMSAILDETPELDEPSSVRYGLLGQTIVWANYDHYHTNGTLLCAATDPIPVSGIVDYNGDIPIYE